VTSIEVSLASAVPVYEQIRAQVAAFVAVGALRAGDRLPASRDLARDLGIAVGTVQRAYRELEVAGVVASRRRTGTVVSHPDQPVAEPSAVVVAARELVLLAREARLSDAALLDVGRGAQPVTS
jgi:DNA-binding transcriptional regulator YhcF (GntR family)